MADKVQVPSIGRIVHYVLPSGENKGDHRPAIITRVWSNGVVNLQVFTDGDYDGKEYETGIHRVGSASHAEAHLHEFGTYHWPEYVPAVEAAVEAGA